MQSPVLMLITYTLMIDMVYKQINFNFSNKIVLVSGGSRGIGLGLVKSFLDSGAEVFYLSRNPISDSGIKGAKHISIDLVLGKYFLLTQHWEIFSFYSVLGECFSTDLVLGKYLPVDLVLGNMLVSKFGKYRFFF